MAIHRFQGDDCSSWMAGSLRGASCAFGSLSYAASRGGQFPHLELHRRGTAVRGVPPFRTSTGE